MFYDAVMRIIVDRGACEANGVCMSKAPEAFRLEDDDTLTILIDSVPDELHDKVELAVERCPKFALSLVD